MHAIEYRGCVFYVINCERRIKVFLLFARRTRACEHFRGIVIQYRYNTVASEYILAEDWPRDRNYVPPSSGIARTAGIALIR